MGVSRLLIDGFSLCEQREELEGEAGWTSARPPGSRTEGWGGLWAGLRGCRAGLWGGAAGQTGTRLWPWVPRAASSFLAARPSQGRAGALASRPPGVELWAAMSDTT